MRGSTLVATAFALCPLAAASGLALSVMGRTLRVQLANRHAPVARSGREAGHAFPLAQLLTDPVEHVAGTGALMTFIGALFLLRRSSVPASAARGAAPRA